MKTPAVELRGLTKRYVLTWQRRVLLALDQLDLRVEAGEVFGLLGPNGSGKSTTMKLLLGLMKPTAGEALVFGESAQVLATRRRLGFLPENPYFHKFLTATETLRFYGQLCGLGGKALRKRSEELLELVGLTASRDNPLGSYSKGMLQRVGLAQALVHDPDLILLDEPTAGVDPLGAHEIKVLIGQLKKLGKTVIFSSHLLDEVEAVADRVAILHLGKKILEGSLTDLLQVDEITEMRMKDLPASAQVAVEQVASEHGAREVSFRRGRCTLEELYVRTVRGNS